jgi:hypothetical protein
VRIHLICFYLRFGDDARLVRIGQQYGTGSGMRLQQFVEPVPTLRRVSAGDNAQRILHSRRQFIVASNTTRPGQR